MREGEVGIRSFRGGVGKSIPTSQQDHQGRDQQQKQGWMEFAIVSHGLEKELELKYLPILHVAGCIPLLRFKEKYLTRLIHYISM